MAAKKGTVYAIPDNVDRRLAERRQESAYRIPENVDVIELIEGAKKAFYQDPNVIGVGIGERRKEDQSHRDEVALIVYVKAKLPKGDINKDYLIPSAFQEIATDVVAPFGLDAPREAMGFVEGHQHSDDMTFIDYPRLHEQWMAEAGLHRTRYAPHPPIHRDHIARPDKKPKGRADIVPEWSETNND